MQESRWKAPTKMPRDVTRPNSNEQAAELRVQPDQSDGPGSGGLPSRMRLLCLGPQEPSWVNLTLSLNAQGCLEPHFQWVSTSAEALTLLRDESFDCILVADELADDSSVRPGESADSSHGTHARAQCDALAFLHAVRASGCDDPVVVMTAYVQDLRAAEFYRIDGELIVTPSLWESPLLVQAVKRAASHVELVRENHRLSLANRRRLVRERDEAEHLLRQQRQIIAELETIAGSAPSEVNAKSETDADTTTSNELGAGRTNRAGLELPGELNDYYHELLRTYVIMGSGNLGSEIARLAELIATLRLTPRETMEVHLERVESLVRGLGSRSARHVMARADLLALELMIHLGECYQQSRIDGEANDSDRRSGSSGDPATRVDEAATAALSTNLNRLRQRLEKLSEST